MARFWEQTTNKTKTRYERDLVKTKSMAILNYNIPELGGRYGDVVVYQMLGKMVARSMPKKSNHTPTHGQLVHRAKFTLVARFLSPLRDLISKGYTDIDDIRRARLSAASSYHINAAITGEYPDFSIDYSKVVLSRGELPPLTSFGVMRNADSVAITWQDNGSQSLASARDGLFIAVYHPEYLTVRLYSNTAFRAAGSCIIQLPAEWSDGPLHLWGGYSNAEGQLWSTSLYLGLV